MRRLWVFLVACSAPARPSEVRAVIDPVGQPYCPPLEYAEVGYWASELFPACQDPPFGFTLTLCNGARCPRPCTRTVGDGSGGNESWKLTYTDAGKFQTARSTMGMFDTECFWDRGKLAACTEGAHSFNVVRDARGRITAIVSDATTEIRYDARGRVIAVGARGIAYDDVGRVTRVGTTAIEWDARGRVVRERAPDATRTLTYDERDRLVGGTVEDDSPPEPPAPPPPAPPAPTPADPSSPALGTVLDLGTIGESVEILAAPPGVRIIYDHDRVSSINTMTFGYDCK